MVKSSYSNVGTSATTSCLRCLLAETCLTPRSSNHGFEILPAFSLFGLHVTKLSGAASQHLTSLELPPSRIFTVSEKKRDNRI